MNYYFSGSSAITSFISGFFGQEKTESGNCTKNVNECEDNPCEHGTCNDTEGSFDCSCNEGWSKGDGKICSENKNECEENENPCVHGTCIDTVGSFNCSCDVGWSKKENENVCSENINECLLDNPCEHGNCTDTVGSFICDCHSGWEKEENGGLFSETKENGNCTKNIDECKWAINPCGNGECIDTDGGYNCTCDDGWLFENGTCGSRFKFGKFKLPTVVCKKV